MLRQMICGLAVFLWVSTALSATCRNQQTAPTWGYKETLAVPYSADQSGNIIKRVDDVNPPVVVFIHGGWFQANSANGLDPEARALAYNAHVAVFNIDYHLTVPMTPTSATLNQFPVAVRDARCALRWAANPVNGAAWGFDSTRIGLIGFSAGANLASMAVVARGADYDDPACPNAGRPAPVRAVAGYYGVYDFTAGNWAQAQVYIGGQTTTSPAGILASPTRWVSPAYAPYPWFMFVRGTSDTLFPQSQQDAFATVLRAAGSKVWTENVVGVGHGFGAFDVNYTPVVAQSSCDLVSFFNTHLRGG